MTQIFTNETKSHTLCTCLYNVERPIQQFFFFLYSESLDVKLLQNQRYKALGNLFKQRPILYKEALLLSVQQLAGTCLGQLPGDRSIAAGYFQ